MPPTFLGWPRREDVQLPEGAWGPEHRHWQGAPRSPFLEKQPVLLLRRRGRNRLGTLSTPGAGRQGCQQQAVPLSSAPQGTHS